MEKKIKTNRANLQYVYLAFMVIRQLSKKFKASLCFYIGYMYFER